VGYKLVVDTENIMNIETTRFGSVEVDDDRVITFTQPILGFADCTRYVLIEGPRKGSVYWLQSITRPEVAFLVMDPLQIMPDYEVNLAESEVRDLELADEKQAVLFTLVVVPEDKRLVRTNLRAPVIYNPHSKLAKQVVLYDSDYPVKYYLRPETRAAKAERTEDNDAGSDQENR